MKTNLSELMEIVSIGKKLNFSLYNQFNSLLKQFVSKMVSENCFIITPEDYKDILLSIKENNKECRITIDIPIVIRPRHAYLKTPLVNLENDELFNALAINTFEFQPFNDGSYKQIYRSTRQYHYNQEGYFESKDNNKKALGLNMILIPGANFIIPEDKQDGIREMLAKKSGNRGVYFLSSLEDKLLGMVSPHIEGGNLQQRFDTAVSLYGTGQANPKHHENQFKIIILNFFKELAILHLKSMIHRDIKTDNIMLPDLVDTRLIDFDLTVFLNEKIARVRGSPPFIPFLAYQQFLNEGTATPYQDVYGGLICSALLMNHLLQQGFYDLIGPLWTALDNNEIDTYYFQLRKIQQYFIDNLKKSKNRFVKENILAGLLNTSVTSFELLVNMLNTDISLTQYAAEIIVKEASKKEAKILDKYIKGYHKRCKYIFVEERTQFSTYLAECFMGIKTFSLKQLESQVKRVSSEDLNKKLNELIEKTEDAIKGVFPLPQQTLSEVVSYLTKENSAASSRILRYCHALRVSERPLSTSALIVLGELKRGLLNKGESFSTNAFIKQLRKIRKENQVTKTVHAYATENTLDSVSFFPANNLLSYQEQSGVAGNNLIRYSQSSN